MSEEKKNEPELIENDLLQVFGDDGMIELQKAGNKIIGQPALFHIDTGKMIYNITYDNTNMKIEKDE